MNAGVAHVIDDNTGLVHWAYFAPEIWARVSTQTNALVVATTMCIESSTRLAPGKQVTCIRCIAKYAITYASVFPVIDGA